MQFISKKYSNLTVVLDPRTYVIEGGRRMMTSLNDQFKNGRRIEFKNNLYETKDPEEIKALKEHAQYGIAFFADGEKAELKTEGLRALNEKKEMAQEAGSICPWCGDKFKNEQGLEIHQRTCKRKP